MADYFKNSLFTSLNRQTIRENVWKDSMKLAEINQFSSIVHI